MIPELEIQLSFRKSEKCKNLDNIGFAKSMIKIMQDMKISDIYVENLDDFITWHLFLHLRKSDKEILNGSPPIIDILLNESTNILIFVDHILIFLKKHNKSSLSNAINVTKNIVSKFVSEKIIRNETNNILRYNKEIELPQNNIRKYIDFRDPRIDSFIIDFEVSMEANYYLHIKTKRSKIEDQRIHALISLIMKEVDISDIEQKYAVLLNKFKELEEDLLE